MTQQGKSKLTSDYFAVHTKEIETVLRRAVDHALSTHRRLGNSIATWKDGKVVIVPADEIVLSSELPRTKE